MTAPETPPPILVTPPWTLAPEAAEVMRRHISVAAVVAGVPLELSWSLEVDPDRYHLYAPRLVFIGAERTTRIPAAAYRPGCLIVHQHPGERHAVPSPSDCDAAAGPEPTCGFAVANADVSRLLIMRAPERPRPPARGWARSLRLGSFWCHVGRTA